MGGKEGDRENKSSTCAAALESCLFVHLSTDNLRIHHGVVGVLGSVITLATRSRKEKVKSGKSNTRHRSRKQKAEGRRQTDRQTDKQTERR